MSLPFGKFYWSDYASDPALKLCSFAAQGLWMRMLCTAAEHDPAGYVAVNSKGLDAMGIARVTGGSLDEVSQLIDELESNGVFSRDRRGWIYSRRMINDAKKRRIAQATGKLGGNPKLRKQTGNSGDDKGVAKGEEKGGLKTHIPEARVQREKTVTKKALPEAFDPEPFGEGTESAKIEASWDADERKRQLEAFKAHHTSHGSRFVDWHKAWSTWIINSVKFQKPRNAQAPPGSGYLAHVVSHVIPELEKEEDR